MEALCVALRRVREREKRGGDGTTEEKGKRRKGKKKKKKKKKGGCNGYPDSWLTLPYPNMT